MQNPAHTCMGISSSPAAPPCSHQGSSDQFHQALHPYLVTCQAGKIHLAGRSHATVTAAPKGGRCIALGASWEAWTCFKDCAPCQWRTTCPHRICCLLGSVGATVVTSDWTLHHNSTLVYATDRLTSPITVQSICLDLLQLSGGFNTKCATAE